MNPTDLSQKLDTGQVGTDDDLAEGETEDPLEEAWQGIERSLRLAVKLLSSFGFSASTLKANSVLIPIAHYLHARAHDDRYLTHATWRDDREALRSWTHPKPREAGDLGKWSRRSPTSAARRD